MYGTTFSKADRWHARQWLVNYLIVAFKTAKEDMELIQTDRGTEMKDAEARNNNAKLVRSVTWCLHSVVVVFKILIEATATGALNDFYALRCYHGLQSL